MADMFMPTPLPAVNSSAMGGMMPFISPDQIAQNQTDMLQWQQKQALAQQLMQSQYMPNTGRAGVAGTILERVMGALGQNQNNAKLSDILKQQFQIENQAAQAKRQQDLEDEQRKMLEEIQKGVTIARGTAQAGKEFAKPEFTGGGVFDPSSGSFAPNADWMNQQLKLKQAEANIAAAGRAPAADPFADIKAALTQGVITPEQAKAAMAKKVTGDVGGLSPKDQMAIDKRLPVLQDQTNKIDTALDIANKMKDQMKTGGYDVGGIQGFRNAFAPSYYQSTGGQELGTDSGNLILAAQAALQGTGNRGSVAQLKILEKSKPNAQMDATANTNAINEIIKTLETARKNPAAELEHYGQGGTPTSWAQVAAKNAAAGGAGTPDAGASAPAAQAAPTATATGPNGQKIGLVNGQWVPL